MFAHAAELVARTGNIDVIRLFARTLMEMATGELHQDMSAYQYGQSTREYFNRIAGKTASLFATAAQGGGMIAGLPDEQSLALRAYGENLGMAFQIVDDILDFTGERGGAGQAGRQRPDAGHADPAGAAADRALPGRQPGGALLRRPRGHGEPAAAPWR